MLQPWLATYADGKLARAQRALTSTELTTNLYREGCQSSDVIVSAMVATGSLMLSPENIRARLAAELVRMWARWPKMLCSVQSTADGKIIVYDTPTDADVQRRAAASVHIVQTGNVRLDQHLNRTYDMSMDKTPVEVYVRICSPSTLEIACVCLADRSDSVGSSRRTP